MRSGLVVLIAVLFIGIAESQAVDATKARYVPNELIVELTDDSTAPLNAIKKRYGSGAFRRLHGRVGDSQAALEQHQAVIGVKYAQRRQRQPLMLPPPSLHRFWVLTLPGKAADMELIAREVATMPGVKNAGPNYYLTLYSVPNDPYYPTSGAWGQSNYDLWGLQKIQMEGAWSKSTGSPNITVAVADTGVDW